MGSSWGPAARPVPEEQPASDMLIRVPQIVSVDTDSTKIYLPGPLPPWGGGSLAFIHILPFPKDIFSFSGA